MSQANKASDQTAAQAMAAVDSRKDPKTGLRPQGLKGSGKAAGKMGSVMFDKVRDGMVMPAALLTAVNIYFDLMEERGGKHQHISLQDIDNARDEEWDKVYDQLPSTQITHYAPRIRGDETWRHKQPKFVIGSFK
jgi:hypothetical protein